MDFILYSRESIAYIKKFPLRFYLCLSTSVIESQPPYPESNLKHFTAPYVFFVYFLPLTLDCSKCGHPSWFRPRLLTPVSILFCYLVKILLSLFEPKLKYYQKNMAVFNFFPIHLEIHSMIIETLYVLLFCIFLAFLSFHPTLSSATTSLNQFVSQAFYSHFTSSVAHIPTWQLQEFYMSTHSNQKYIYLPTFSMNNFF